MAPSVNGVLCGGSLAEHSVYDTAEGLSCEPCGVQGCLQEVSHLYSATVTTPGQLFAGWQEQAHGL